MKVTKILTTGGSGGLGASLLKLLLDNGFDVRDISFEGSRYANSVSSHPNFSKTLIDIGKFDEDTPLSLDFSEFDHVVFMHAILHQKNFLQVTKKEFLNHLEVNFLGTFFLSQRVIQSWLDKKEFEADKSITFISSVATKGGSPSEVPYHSSKRAMESAMLSFARDLSNKNIRANVISPGLMATKLGIQTLESRPDLLDRIPLGRAVDPKDIAETVLMCIKNKSITGENIHVNCGRYFGI